MFGLCDCHNLSRFGLGMDRHRERGDTMKRLLNFLLGCRHKHTSRVWTPKQGWHYVTCFDCGAELQYDWRRMKVVA